MDIIDAHVHLFAQAPRADSPYPGAGRVEPVLRWMDQAGVNQAVLVPAVGPQSPANRQECAQLATAHPDRLALLADVSLHEPTAAAAITGARAGGAVGISYYPATPTLEWLLAPACEALWAACAAHRLPCNLHGGPAAFAVVRALAERYPEIAFVVSHYGLPGKHFEPDHPTYGGLASQPVPANLWVKASAWYSVAAHGGDEQDPRATAYLQALVRHFGPERVMWGSDWPPAAATMTYAQALAAVRGGLSHLAPAQVAAVLGGNARRVFAA
jgi:predicted TIM-barrel fold metal-dependent hydrolase